MVELDDCNVRQYVECWQAGSGEDVGGKAGAAFPLKPSLLYE